MARDDFSAFTLWPSAKLTLKRHAYVCSAHSTLLGRVHRAVHLTSKVVSPQTCQLETVGLSVVSKCELDSKRASFMWSGEGQLIE